MNTPPPPRVTILGAPISIITMASALQALAERVKSGQGGYVCISDVNSMMQTRSNPAHLKAFKEAFMVTPDGMPLSVVARAAGVKGIGRVSGPDLLPTVCAWPAAHEWTHYFYGSKPETLQKLEANLKSKFPNLKILGLESPPFRPLTAEETMDLHQRLNALKPTIIWVGLGAPKQEKWMRENAPKLKGAILIGVGAAFDFHAGTVERAPLWMQKNGLEWLHRLLSEPKRLWRRYLVVAPHFAVLAIVGLLRGTIKA